MVDPARKIVEPFGAVSEMRREPAHVLRGEIGTRIDAEPLHLRRGYRADAVEAADRQRLDKGGALARRAGFQPVGLVLVRRQLGNELVVGPARREIGTASWRERVGQDG